MRKILYYVFIFVFIFSSGCNIVPKSVQYQREEEKLLGSVDIINPIVEEIQVVLDSLGYDVGKVDGMMGEKTRQAIKDFQESRGLKSTGYINKSTLTQIDDIRRVSEEAALDRSYKVEVRSAYSEVEIEEEKESHVKIGVSVTQIQTALKNAGFDPGAIDGKMGRRTQQAVKEFQRAKGLKIDGKVGPKTWGELGKYLE